MNAARPLDKEMTQFWGHLSIEQKKVVLSVVKSFAREEEAWIDDKAYWAEMDKRYMELKTGKVKALTLDELEAGARKAYKNKQKKK
jgi:hypothetical protein